jgi:electron transport complex protein RnfG
MANETKAENRQSVWRSALALGLVAVLGTALLAGVNQATRQRIEDQQRRAVIKQLSQVVNPELFDNAIYDDHYTFSDTDWFPSGQSITVYRARKNSQAAAAVFRLAARDGYNGDIHLLIGIYADGSISGVRVISHKETPGLGDAIETGKSDWVLAFNGRRLKQDSESTWAVRKDGGQFDQFTGATITPRAVVKAVRLALAFYKDNPQVVFSHAADPREK